MTMAIAVHLEAGGWSRCGHRRAACLTRYEDAVTCGACLNRMRGGNTLGLQLSRAEDYLFIGGDRMSAAEAAARLGVTVRTVQRYRAVLRRAGQYRRAA